MIGEIARIHLAQHPLQLRRREYIAQHIEDLARPLRVQVALDLRDALEELV